MPSSSELAARPSAVVDTGGMGLFRCHATNAVDRFGNPPGVDVADEYGMLVRRSERAAGWAGRDGYDLTLLDRELRVLGFRRVADWVRGAEHMQTFAEWIADSPR